MNTTITVLRGLGWFILAVLLGIAGMSGASAAADERW